MAQIGGFVTVLMVNRMATTQQIAIFRWVGQLLGQHLQRLPHSLTVLVTTIIIVTMQRLNTSANQSKTLQITSNAPSKSGLNGHNAHAPRVVKDTKVHGRRLASKPRIRLGHIALAGLMVRVLSMMRLGTITLTTRIVFLQRLTMTVLAINRRVLISSITSVATQTSEQPQQIMVKLGSPKRARTQSLASGTPTVLAWITALTTFFIAASYSVTPPRILLWDLLANVA